MDVRCFARNEPFRVPHSVNINCGGFRSLIRRIICGSDQPAPGSIISTTFAGLYGTRSVYFSPVPKNSTGMPVTFDMDIELPPFASQSNLVKNALRMRPDMIIIGEVRGEEANDMMTAMNIGKISMGTIHASSTRDMINRLQHAPMNVPKDIIPVIDALIILAQVYEKNKPSRKIVQISEISGMETQILLSDLYKFDYKTHKAAPILPSVTYRDTLSTVLGVPPPDILAEENVRANILFAMNKQGTRDMVSINNIVKDYYDNPEATLKKLGLNNMQPVIKI